MASKREYNRDEPVALDQRDPSNSEPENFTAPLDPDDDIYAMVNPTDIREARPVGDGETSRGA